MSLDEYLWTRSLCAVGAAVTSGLLVGAAIGPANVQEVGVAVRDHLPFAGERQGQPGLCPAALADRLDTRSPNLQSAGKEQRHV